MSKKKWYQPFKKDTGWHKDLPAEKRRELALKAHKGDYLAAAYSLQALANITTDKATRDASHSDASYFFEKHKQEVK
jgi:hypothetical protein